MQNNCQYGNCPYCNTQIEAHEKSCPNCREEIKNGDLDLLVVD